MDPLTSLTPDRARSVIELAEAAAQADGASPLNEDARLHLEREGALHWLLDEGGALVGYAQWHPEHGSGQLVVHPDHRRRGHGATLLDAILGQSPDAGIWSFGTSDAARAFAAARGLTAVRGLHIMERPLEGVAAPEPQAGITIRPFTTADAAAFLRVNASAFVDHPEQGHFDLDDLTARMNEPWFDADGFLLAEGAGEGVLGFHWTKRHDARTGEVYVLGVHPDAGGRGLGRLLLDAGLAHLAEGGAERVILYVDADNTPAVRLYERSGFTIATTDTLFRRP